MLAASVVVSALGTVQSSDAARCTWSPIPAPVFCSGHHQASIVSLPPIGCRVEHERSGMHWHGLSISDRPPCFPPAGSPVGCAGRRCKSTCADNGHLSFFAVEARRTASAGPRVQSYDARAPVPVRVFDGRVMRRGSGWPRGASFFAAPARVPVQVHR